MSNEYTIIPSGLWKDTSVYEEKSLDTELQERVSTTRRRNRDTSSTTEPTETELIQLLDNLSNETNDI